MHSPSSLRILTLEMLTGPALLSAACRIRGLLKIRANDILRCAHHDGSSLFEQQAAVAELGDHFQIVRNKEHCGPAAEHFPHALDALLLERIVPHAQHFVHDQHLWIDVSGYRESEPCIHPRGVTLDWRVNELFDSGEGDDLVELGLDLSPAHAQDRAVKKYILPPGEVLWKPADTSISAERRPLTTMRPLVGFMIRLSIFNAVLFPAPLWPMMPKASPLLYFKREILNGPEFPLVSSH